MIPNTKCLLKEQLLADVFACSSSLDVVLSSKYIQSKSSLFVSQTENISSKMVLTDEHKDYSMSHFVQTKTDLEGETIGFTFIRWTQTRLQVMLTLLCVFLMRKQLSLSLPCQHCTMKCVIGLTACVHWPILTHNYLGVKCYQYDPSNKSYLIFLLHKSVLTATEAER